MQESAVKTPSKPVPTEDLSELFHALLHEHLHVTLGRNDLCPCNSGEKYKKCCLDKDHSSTNPKIQEESFTIKTDALTPEESQANYPRLSEKDEELFHELYYDLHENPEHIDSEDCEYFQELEMLRLKYPDHPWILNYLANGYQCLGLHEKAKQIIIETHKKFPEYLFALTALANIYLEENMPEKTLELLKGAYTLKQLYPKRDVFHVSELRAFACCMVSYFCTIKDFEQANIQLKMLEKVLDPKDVALQQAKKTIKIARSLYYLEAKVKRFLKSEKK